MWKEVCFKVLLLLLTGSAVDARDTVPARVNVVTLEGNGNTCPSDDQRDEARDELHSNINEILRRGNFSYPASSCANIPSIYPSGYYWIKSDDTLNATQQYCDMNRTCSCSSKRQWMRVANLDMTNPNEQCPSGLRHVNFSGLRACGRPESTIGCASVTYPVHGVEYSRVCGRIIGYQFGGPEAFLSYTNIGQTTIDDYYLDGVSLTHGSSPRKHIWTFAAAEDEASSNLPATCPCSNQDNLFIATIPPFVGQDYFCETGSRGTYQTIYYPEDPLWNGQGCGPTSTCCSFNTPPWFCKELPQPTTDDIELRLCGNADSVSNEDTPIEIAEIYAQ